MLSVALLALVLSTPGGKGGKTDKTDKAVVAAPVAPAPQGTKLEQGQALFASGDFDGALKALDAAVSEGGDAATMEKVHLLRAQCFGARQDFGRAEDAFEHALEFNPEASLDPTRVDPTLVKLLDSVRARLMGTVVVRSTPSGASVIVDGKVVGNAPQTISLSSGRHQLSARWDDGEPQVLEVTVRPRQHTRVEYVQKLATGPAGDIDLSPRPFRPFGDLRGVFEPLTSGNIDGGLELGGGIEYAHWRLGLFLRLFPRFELTPRFQFSVPLLTLGPGVLNAVLEVGVPFSFGGVFSVGFQGAAGAEWYLLPWLAPYVSIGGSHRFFPNSGYDTGFVLQGGIRLRVP
ncbi:MAG: PEGA domain-containing protein [Myxococcaceae bacterium]